MDQGTIEREGANHNMSTSFDVNVFLRKTMSDYQGDVSVTFGSPQGVPCRSQHGVSLMSHMSPSDNKAVSVQASTLCPYCGINLVCSDLLCSDCIGLMRNSPEVHRRLLLISRPTTNCANFRNDELVGSISDSAVTPFLIRKVSINPSMSSRSSINSNRPICRICQFPSNKEELMSPCKCAGTMQHVHISCLVRWLEVSTTRKLLKAPKCEVCGYQYRTHSCFSMRTLYTPDCSHKDAILHGVSVLMFIVMVGCVILSVLYLQRNRGARSRSSLSMEDIVVIGCAVLFFSSLTVSVYAQCRTDNATLCTFVLKLWLINKLWRIRNYSTKEEDCES